jgi:hypothetical protein
VAHPVCSECHEPASWTVTTGSFFGSRQLLYTYASLLVADRRHHQPSWRGTVWGCDSCKIAGVNYSRAEITEAEERFAEVMGCTADADPGDCNAN